MQGALQSIGSVCNKPSPGRLTHLYLINSGDFVFESPVPEGSGPAARLVGLKPGASITRIVLRSKTAFFAQGSIYNADGDHYSLSISAPIPAVANDLYSWVLTNKGKRWVALWRDTVGNCYLSGARDNGLRLTWVHGSEAQHTHSLVLTGLQIRPAILLATVEPESLLPDREFDNSFEISFS